VGEQLDVILFGKVFQILRNDAASRQVHLIYARFHLPIVHITQLPNP